MEHHPPPRITRGMNRELSRQYSLTDVHRGPASSPSVRNSCSSRPHSQNKREPKYTSEEPHDSLQIDYSSQPLSRDIASPTPPVPPIHEPTSYQIDYRIPNSMVDRDYYSANYVPPHNRRHTSTILAPRISPNNSYGPRHLPRQPSCPSSQPQHRSYSPAVSGHNDGRTSRPDYHISSGAFPSQRPVNYPPPETEFYRQSPSYDHSTRRGSGEYDNLSSSDAFSPTSSTVAPSVNPYHSHTQHFSNSSGYDPRQPPDNEWDTHSDRVRAWNRPNNPHTQSSSSTRHLQVSLPLMDPEIELLSEKDTSIHSNLESDSLSVVGWRGDPMQLHASEQRSFEEDSGLSEMLLKDSGIDSGLSSSNNTVEDKLKHTVTWKPSKDGRRLVGHMILRKTSNNSTNFPTYENTLADHSAAILGLKVTGGLMTASGRLGAFVSDVKKGSIADTVGHLRPNDEILEWNSKCLKGLTFEHVHSIIQDSRQEKAVHLLVQRYIDHTARHRQYARPQVPSLNRTTSSTLVSQDRNETRLSVPLVKMRMAYEVSAKQLTVTILSAHNLSPQFDNSPACNAFFKLVLQPERSQQHRHQSRPIPSTNNPVWNKMLFFSSISENELRLRNLEITLWDADAFSEQCKLLGEVVIDLSKANLTGVTVYKPLQMSNLGRRMSWQQSLPGELNNFRPESQYKHKSRGGSRSHAGSIHGDFSPRMSELEYHGHDDRSAQSSRRGSQERFNDPTDMNLYSHRPPQEYGCVPHSSRTFSPPSHYSQAPRDFTRGVERTYHQNAPGDINYPNRQRRSQNVSPRLYPRNPELNDVEDRHSDISEASDLSERSLSSYSGRVLSPSGRQTRGYPMSPSSAPPPDPRTVQGLRWSRENAAVLPSDPGVDDLHNSYRQTRIHRGANDSAPRMGGNNDKYLSSNLLVSPPANEISEQGRMMHSEQRSLQYGASGMVEKNGNLDGSPNRSIQRQTTTPNSKTAASVKPIENVESSFQEAAIEPRDSSTVSVSSSGNVTPTASRAALVNPNMYQAQESVPQRQPVHDSNSSSSFSSTNSEITLQTQQTQPGMQVERRKRRSSIGQRFTSVLGLNKKNSTAQDRKPKYSIIRSEEVVPAHINPNGDDTLSTGRPRNSDSETTLLDTNQEQMISPMDASKVVGNSPQPQANRAIILPGERSGPVKSTETTSLLGATCCSNNLEDDVSDFVEGLGPGQLVGRQVLGMTPLGDIQMSFLERQGRLEVEVIRARNLRLPARSSMSAKGGLMEAPLIAAKGKSSLPQPYVKLHLIENSLTVEKQRTLNTVRATLDPLFQEQIMFNTPYRGKVLQVSVWGDFGKMEKKAFMGMCEIHLDKLDLTSILFAWYKLYGIIASAHQRTTVPSFTSSNAAL